MTNLTLFYDGACPLCRREINFLRQLDRRGRIDFKDISPPDAAEFCPVSQDILLTRFHVQRADGKLLDGAEAFTAAYAELPYLSWIGPLGRFPATRWCLNKIYTGFLKIRPALQRLVKD